MIRTIYNVLKGIQVGLLREILRVALAGRPNFYAWDGVINREAVTSPIGRQLPDQIGRRLRFVNDKRGGLDYLAVPEVDDGIGAVGDALVVGDDDECGIGLCLDIEEDIVDRLARL